MTKHPESPVCTHCRAPMRLVKVEANLSFAFGAPPLAHFECDCGSRVTASWARSSTQPGAEPKSSAA